VFINKAGNQTIGWFETKALLSFNVPPKFAGTWTWQKPNSKAKLVITPSGSSFKVKGNASMPCGAGSTDMADLAKNAILEHNALFNAQNKCGFAAFWLNGFLAVVDNGNCCDGVMV
jgi:hypothetical protein